MNTRSLPPSSAGMNAHFAAWREKSAAKLRQLKVGCHPKEVITALSEGLLAHYDGKPLIDNYDVYQRLMDYWSETMQDDCYLVAADRLEGRYLPRHREGQKGQGEG